MGFWAVLQGKNAEKRVQKIGKNKKIDQKFSKILAKIKPPEKKLADPDLKGGGFIFNTPVLE